METELDFAQSRLPYIMGSANMAAANMASSSSANIGLEPKKNDDLKTLKRHREDTNVLCGLLGSGTYGEVYAINMSNTNFEGPKGPEGSMMAMKLMRIIDINEQEALLRTIEYAREIYGLHTHSLFRGFMACAQTGRLGLLMPMFGQRLGNSVLPTYSVPAIASLLRPVAESLAKHPGMHRDVKPANICLPKDANSDATLIDFSLSTNMCESNDNSVITMWYRPLEVLVGLEHTKSADIWSFGVVLLNLLTGLHLNRCATEEAKVCYIMDLLDKFGWPAHWPEFYKLYDSSNTARRGSPVGTFNYKALIEHSCGLYAPAAIDLLSKLLRLKPCERILWPEILAHPFWLFADAKQKPFKASEPTKAHTKDADNFLKTGVFVGTYQLRPPGKINVEIIDTILIFCKKLNFSLSTAYYAISIWKYALIGPDREYLSACVFLAAAYNEDLRDRHFTWTEWVRRLGEPVENERRHAKSAIRILVSSGGYWPNKTWAQTYLEISSSMMSKLKPGEILFENTAMYLFGCAQNCGNALELDEILEYLKKLNT